jgi:hypothetical protein
MLLAAYDARRPTADVDALACGLGNDQDAVVARITEVAGQSVDDDGVEFLAHTAVARAIREDAFYPGVRVAMDARIATAVVRFRLDVNFGDPVTPAPRTVELASLRLDTAPVRVLGYPIETVLAEKLATAIMLGAANTRVRDYADVYTLTGRHDLTHGAVRAALEATARFRGVEIAPLSSVVDDLANLRERTYRAYRTALGADGAGLPSDFGEVVDAVTRFADPLARPTAEPRWHAADRRWIPVT